MSVAPAVTRESTTIRAVPKPARLHQAHQRALVAVEGDLYEDIAADADAAERLETARTIDRRRDILIRRMTRLFTIIRHDLGASIFSRARATEGGALGKEAIRLDAIVDEQNGHGERGVRTSLAAGQRCAAGLERVLVGSADGERCGRRHPLTDELAELGVALLPCTLAPHADGPCLFLAEGAEHA